MRVTCLLAVALAAAAPAPAAELSKYPERPIRMIVPQGPGTTPDVSARIVATELSRLMQQPIVVDNRPAGANLVGLELTARAAPDGYTIAFAPLGSLAVGPHLAVKATIDVRKDLQPISQAVASQMLLVTTPNGPFRNVRQVLDHARQHPGKLHYASSGNGTPSHVGFELLKAMTGAQIVHVPYKGATGIADVSSGQVELLMDAIASLTPHVKAGRLRALGVSSRRSEALPDVPTIAEAAVPGFDITTWGGIVGPAGMSPQIVSRLNAEIGKALAAATVRDRLAVLGSSAKHSTPEEFAALIRAEYVKWGDVVRRSGAKVD